MLYMQPMYRYCAADIANVEECADVNSVKLNRTKSACRDRARAAEEQTCPGGAATAVAGFAQVELIKAF